MIDDRTPNLNLPKPSVGNTLLEDLTRLRSAFDTLDTVVSGKQEALGYTPLNATQKGANSGVCELTSDGFVPSIRLPSYVDDVVEFANFAALPATGEAGKIYVLQTAYTVGGITSNQFRWSGSVYVPISASPGTTDAITEGSVNLFFTAERARAAQLPATAVTPGLVRVGSGLSVTPDGLIAVDANTSFSETVVPITSNGQTAFVVDGGYTAASVQVLLNGVELARNDEFFATDGVNLTLSDGATTSDRLLVRTWKAFLNTGPVSFPAAPVNTAPAGGTTIDSTTTTFSGGAFLAPDGATHAATQVQFSTSAGFGTIALDTGALAAATSVSVNLSTLTLNTTYFWRMRYQGSGGQWSVWSTPTSFVMPVALASYIPTPAATPTNFGDALEGGFYAGMIWNELVQSSTSQSVSLGSKSFTVPSMSAAPIVYQGQQLEIRSRANPTNRMTGTVTFAGGTTLTINVTSVGGSGTFSDWSIMSRYRVILAPKASGQTTGSSVLGALPSTPSTDAGTPSEGFLATVALAAVGSGAASWARSRNIAGYTDWYLPSQDELALVVRNLKPTGGAPNATAARNQALAGPRGAYANTAGDTSGVIKNSDPAYPLNDAVETTNALFSNGAENILLSAGLFYVSSSYISGTTSATYLNQSATSNSAYGAQSQVVLTSSSNSSAYFRAVRRSII